MNFVPMISKITERGQITLPKHLRDAYVFKNAHAVEFEKIPNAVIIRPVKRTARSDEHGALLDYTLRDWSHPDNDDLFDFTPL